MKQYIKKEQWDKLSEKGKRRFIKAMGGLRDNARATEIYYWGWEFLPSIGQLIEFLGDDIQLQRDTDFWYIAIGCEFSNGEVLQQEDSIIEKELIDALWLIVKTKLK